MQDTRQEILSLLQKEGSGTINSIADSMGLATATIRHHLTILERDGFIDVQQQRQAVGRPHLVYSLSNSGRETFPKKYDEFSTQLLTEIRALYGDKAVAELIHNIAERKLTELEQPLEKLTPEERLEILQAILASEGYVSNVAREGDNVLLIQHACPYQTVVQAHPEVCLLSSHLIRSIMDRPHRKRSCLVRGDDACVFEIPLA